MGKYNCKCVLKREGEEKKITNKEKQQR
jgi:hypothetical protein